MSLDVSLVLRMVDRLTGPLKGAASKVEAFEQGLGRTDSARLAAAQARVEKHNAAIERSGAALDRNRNTRDRLRGEAVEAVAMGAALVAALRPAIAFESAMADVTKVVDFKTPEGLAAMQASILELSSTIPITQGGLANIIAAAGQAGIVDKMLPDEDKRLALLRFTEDAARMGVAFDMGAEQAGKAMTGLRSVLGLNQTEVVAHADAINHLSNNMDAYARDIVAIENRTGSQAALVGLLPDQLAALSATFLDLKTPPEVAATGINALLQKLGDAEGQGKKFQSALQSIGLDATGLKRALKDDAQGALMDFLERVRGSDDVVGTLSALFGLEYSDDIAKLVVNLDKYKAAIAMTGDADRSGSMLAEYAARSATTENALQLLANQLRSIAIVSGSTVLPALNDLLAGLAPVLSMVTAWAGANPELVRTVVMVAAGLVAMKIATVAAGFAFSGAATPILMAHHAWRRVAGSMAVYRAAALGAAPATGGLAATTGRLSRTLRVGMVAALRAPLLPLRVLGAALLLNPLGLMLTSIATGAFLIHRYWQPIGAFFGGALAEIGVELETLQGLFAPVLDLFSSAGGFLTATFGDTWTAIESLFKPVESSVEQLQDWEAAGKRTGSRIAEAIDAVLSPIRRVRTAVLDMIAWFGTLSLDGFSWPEIPALDLAGRVERLTGWDLPAFAWPTIPALSLAAFVGWITSWRLPSFNWPTVPTLDIAGRIEQLKGWSLPAFAWPTIPTLSLAAFVGWITSWRLPSFSWPTVPTLDIAARVERLTGWSLPAFAWPTIPTLSLAAFVGWITSWRLPSFSWPTVPTLDIAARFERITSWELPSFEWPSIEPLRLAERFTALTGWNLPPFAWPDIEPFDLAGKVNSITGWDLPPLQWPSIDALDRVLGGISGSADNAVTSWEKFSGFFGSLLTGLTEGLEPLKGAFDPIYELLGSLLESFGSLFGSIEQNEVTLEEWKTTGEWVGEKIALAIRVILGPIQLVQDAIVTLMSWFDRLAEKLSALKAPEWMKSMKDWLPFGGGKEDATSAAAKDESVRRAAIATMPPETRENRARVAELQGGLLSGAASIALTGARALGGVVRSGGSYLVGENGPEIIAPSGPGFVLPAALSSAIMAAGMIGGPTSVAAETSMAVRVDARPAIVAPAQGSAGGSSISIAAGAIVVNAAPGQDANEIARTVMREIQKQAKTKRHSDGDLHDGRGLFE